MPKVEPVTELPEGGDDFGVARALATMVMMAAASVPQEPGPERDRFMMGFALSEPILAGAIYAMVTTLATSRFRLVGEPQKVAAATHILDQAELGSGFSHFIASIAYSALTTDSGGWFEIVRPAVVRKSRRPVTRTEVGWVDERGATVDPGDIEVVYPSVPLTLISLDPTRCIPTGDPSRPLRYLYRDGGEVTLAWYQCGRIVDMPMPGSVYGRCAVGRVLSAAQLMSDVLQWHADRLSGNMARMVVISSASPRAIEKALSDAARSAVQSGSRLYVPPVFVSPLDPSASPAAEKIMLADLPPGFNMAEYREWYLGTVALCLGLDYGSLWPLPGSRLGTATEAEVMARLSSRRGPGFFQRQIAHVMNTRGILPAGVRLEYIAADYTEELEAARARLTRAQERATRLKAGEITEPVARQIAADCGDLDPAYLSLFGETDFTPPPEGKRDVTEVEAEVSGG